MKNVHNKHFQYMKIYSEHRHNLMCGYYEHLKEEMDMMNEWLEDYRKANPDYPRDSEIPYWTSIEGREFFDRG